MADIKILNPPNTNISDLKTETIQEAGKIIAETTYPNGFILETINCGDEVSINTNRPLIKINESTYQIPE